jgi:hypothetical protein
MGMYHKVDNINNSEYSVIINCYDDKNNKQIYNDFNYLWGNSVPSD